jgi:hypothetical protein
MFIGLFTLRELLLFAAGTLFVGIAAIVVLVRMLKKEK